MTPTLRRAAPGAPGLADLVAEHRAWLRAHDPDGTDHSKTPQQLAAAGVQMIVAARGAALLGMGGLYEFAPGQGEIKSVFVRPVARGAGVGRQVMGALIAEAAARGMTGLWLETGTHPAMAPARRLYENLGFVACAPFDAYVEDPSSAFYWRGLTLDDGRDSVLD